jgi:hypothetical protein
VLDNKQGYCVGNELLLKDEDLIFGILNPEDEGIKLLRNIYNHSPENEASYPKILESSAAPL